MRKTIVLIIIFICIFFTLIYLAVTRQTEKKVYTTISHSTSDKIVKAIPTPTLAFPAYPTLADLFLNIDNKDLETVSAATSSVKVSGKTAPGAYIIINEYELVASDGTFSKTITLDEGENYVSIFAYTMEGASAEKEIVIIRQLSEE